MLVALRVFRFEASKARSELHPLNMSLNVVTREVSRPAKSTYDRLVHPLNIPSIAVTLEVFKPLRPTETRDVQYANISASEVLRDMSSGERSTYLRLLHP